MLIAFATAYVDASDGRSHAGASTSGYAYVTLTCRPRISNSDPSARFFASSEWMSSSLNSQGVETRPASQALMPEVTRIPAARTNQCNRTRSTLSGPPVRSTMTPVRTQPLGESDLIVSGVGLGCNNFGGRIDLERAREVVDAALDADITFFDTADIYGNRGGSERFLGELLRGRRERVVLATKFGMDMGEGPNGSAEYLRRAIRASLDRLQTDHVDLYYYHRPDGVTPIGETLSAMQELVEEGLVRAIGCSNFSAAQLAEADELARASGRPRFVCVQNEYSLLERDAEEDVLPLTRELGVAFIPYFPLASGLLTGKYRRGEPRPKGTRLEGREIDDATFDRLEALERFARERGHSLLELAIAALASQPGVPSVIAGATSAQQVRANAAAAGWELSPDELAELARPG
jgi:aryl-alcohol dehydrogenase-like predicted oxidoreductase